MDTIETSGINVKVSKLAIQLVTPLLPLSSVELPRTHLSASAFNYFSALAWQQYFDAPLSSAPPQPIYKNESGATKNNFLSTLAIRFKLWSSREWSNAMGIEIPWWKFPGIIWRRIYRDLKVYRVAQKSGGTDRSEIHHHIESDSRTHKIQDILREQS